MRKAYPTLATLSFIKIFEIPFLPCRALRVFLLVGETAAVCSENRN
jgi:hypothetical protein